MKKTFLLANLVLVALCFAGCESHHKPTDLRLFELKGDVASVRRFYTSDVTSTGQMRRNSYFYEGIGFSFNESGELILYNEAEPIIQRKSGNIVEMEVPGAFGGNVYTYTWSKEGLPEREDCVPDEGLDSHTLFKYNRYDSCSLESKLVCVHVDENEEEQSEWTYDERIRDSHGNWLVRVATERRNGHTSYTLEERVITYYTHEDNEWLYGTWKCLTPVGPVVLYIEEDGRMYSNMDRQLHSYSIDGDKLRTFCNGDILPFDIDRMNERIQCYEGMWFRKIY